MGSSVILPVPGQPKTGPDSDFKSATQPKVTSFTFNNLQPPSPLYIDRDDRLLFRVFNSAPTAQLRIIARILAAPVPGNPEGHKIVPLVFDLTPTINRSNSDLLIDLVEGFLLDVVVTAPVGPILRGQTFVFVSLIRGSNTLFNSFQTLISDYMTGRVGLGWPGGSLKQSVESVGAIRSIAGTLPAAGANIIETVPTAARWRLNAVTFTLTTSATVATRTVNFQIDDGVNPLFVRSPNVTQVASLVIRYNVANFGGQDNTTDPTQAFIQIPANFPMVSSFRLRTSAVNLQVGDQFSAPQYEVEEWIES